MTKNELRRDPVSGNWTIVLKNSQKVESILQRAKTRQKSRGSSCEYCEGHEFETPPEIFAIRAEQSSANEPGWQVRVVPEKYPVLQIYGDLNNRGIGIYDVLDGIGAHELVIETPKHSIDLSEFSPPQIEDVLLTFKERILDLKQDLRFRYVLVHRAPRIPGSAGDQHSFSQIIATPITPLLVKGELTNSKAHFRYKERCLFCDIIRQEQEAGVRVILENDQFIALSPFAARAPFQLMILPKRHETFFEWNNELLELAELMHQVFAKFRAVLHGLQYIMDIHSGPNLAAGKQRGYWRTLEKDFHWHLEITPRVMAYSSFEVSSGFQVNPVAPELATQILRAGSYKKN